MPREVKSIVENRNTVETFTPVADLQAQSLMPGRFTFPLESLCHISWAPPLGLHTDKFIVFTDHHLHSADQHGNSEWGAVLFENELEARSLAFEFLRHDREGDIVDLVARAVESINFRMMNGRSYILEEDPNSLEMITGRLQYKKNRIHLNSIVHGQGSTISPEHPAIIFKLLYKRNR